MRTREKYCMYFRWENKMELEFIFFMFLIILAASDSMILAVVTNSSFKFVTALLIKLVIYAFCLLFTLLYAINMLY